MFNTRSFSMCRLIKLGTFCKKTDGTEGTVTHWRMDQTYHVSYFLQPAGLKPDTGHPVDGTYLEEEDLEVSPKNFENLGVVKNVLGLQIKDVDTMFTGTAVSLIHRYGHFNVEIKPDGHQVSGAPIACMEVNIHRCEEVEIPISTPASTTVLS